MDTSITGAHSHSPDELASQLKLRYAKDKTVNAEINLKNKSDKQLRLNGDASLAFPGELWMETVQYNWVRYDNNNNNNNNEL